ncbi:O-antigen ligase family protein [Phocaeicola sp.]
MLKNSKSEYKGWLLDFILCIPFYNAQYFAELPATKFIFTYSRLLIALVLFFFYLKHKFAKDVILSMALMASCLIMNTYLNGDDVMLAFGRYYSIFGIVLLAALRRNNYKRFTLSVFYSSELFIYLNLITMLLYPNGLYSHDHWLIGQKQDFVTVFLVAILASLILWVNNRRRKRVICLATAICVSLSIILSLGLSISLFLLVAMVYFSAVKGKHFSSKFLFVTNIVLECFMIAMTLFLKQFVYIIDIFNSVKASDELSKGDTLMMRITMWNDAIDTVMKHPLGIGYLTESNFHHYINFNYHPHVHNMMLDLVFTGGVLSLVAFIYINYKVYKALADIKSIERDIFAYTIFAMNVLMLTECFYWPFAYGIYILALDYVYNYHKHKRLELCLN